MASLPCQVRSSWTKPAGEAVGEVEAFSPGAEAEPLAAVLEPGTYTIQCILETEDGKIHKDLGMVAMLTVE
jgi:plastocyanin